MNQVATQKAETGLSYKNVSIAQTGGGGMLLPQTFGEVVAFATMMARSQHAIPKHLRENDGACMAITMQALRWDMDPFMVASKSYNVKDLIAYEAQLVAAVVNTRAPIAKRPVYRYEGVGDTRKCIVSCEMLDGSVKEYESPEVGKITTKNSPLWKADTDQQLGYFSIRSWARRHTPEVILGVYTPDEAEQFSGPDKAKDITPSQPSVMDRLKARSATQEPQEEPEGFSRSFVADEPHDALTGEIKNAGEEIPAQPADDAAPATAALEGDDQTANTSSPSTSQDIPAGVPEEFRQHFIDFARKALKTASDTNLTEAQRNEKLEEMNLQYREVIPQELWGKLSGVKLPAMFVVTGQRTKEKAASYIAVDLLDCSVAEIGG